MPIIYSGLCFLLGIRRPFRGPDYHSLWATQRGADHIFELPDGQTLRVIGTETRTARGGTLSKVFLT